MKRYMIVGALALSISVSLFPMMAWAEEAAKPAPVPAAVAPQAAPAQEAADTEFSYGTVKSISGNQIVVSEYDYDADKDVEVAYTTTADTKLENVKSVQEIAVGDSVDIDFAVKNGQKVASALTVEKPTDENEDAALDLQDKQPEADQPATATR